MNIFKKAWIKLFGEPKKDRTDEKEPECWYNNYKDKKRRKYADTNFTAGQGSGSAYDMINVEYVSTK